MLDCGSNSLETVNYLNDKKINTLILILEIYRHIKIYFFNKSKKICNYNSELSMFISFDIFFIDCYIKLNSEINLRKFNPVLLATISTSYL